MIQLVENKHSSASLPATNARGRREPFACRSRRPPALRANNFLNLASIFARLVP